MCADSDSRRTTHTKTHPAVVVWRSTKYQTTRRALVVVVGFFFLCWIRTRLTDTRRHTKACPPLIRRKFRNSTYKLENILKDKKKKYNKVSSLPQMWPHRGRKETFCDTTPGIIKDVINTHDIYYQ